MITLEDSELQTFENYLLAENKQDFLKKLIPGTDLYYYFNLLDGFHSSNGQLSDENKKNLESYDNLKTTRSRSLKVRDILCRLAVSKDEKERKECIDLIGKPLLLSRPLNYAQPSNFSGSNLNIESQQQYQSELNEKLIEINVEEVYNDFLAFENLNPEFLAKLDTKKLTSSPIKIIERFLSGAEVAFLEDIPELIKVVYDHYTKRKDQSQPQTYAGIIIPQQQQSQIRSNPLGSNNRNDVFDDLDFGAPQQQMALRPQLRNDEISDPFSQEQAQVVIEGPNNQDFDGGFEFVSPPQQQQMQIQFQLQPDLFLGDAFGSFTNPVPRQYPNQDFDLSSIQRQKWDEFVQYSSIYSRLNLKQLETLKSLISESVNSPAFVSELLTREFKIEAPEPTQSMIQSREDRVRHREKLLKLYSWTRNYKIQFPELYKQVLFELLSNGLELESYNMDHFIEYLRLPGNYYNYQSVPNTLQPNRFPTSSQNFAWQSILHFNVGRYKTIDELAKLYLHHFFTSAKEIQPFDQYFDTNYLERIFYEVKLHLGESFSDISRVLGPHEIKALNDAKEITILQNDAEYFKHGEDVKLRVRIKNIPSLLVKVHEFNTESYYRKHSKKIDLTINLDGIVASEEKFIEFTEAPIVKHVKELTFDGISKKKQGFYIIDLLGGGLSSRAIIKKGRLNYIERSTISGHLLTLIDEESEVLKGDHVGVWFENRYHPANSDGQVIIPYSESPRTSNLVIINGDYAEFTQFSVASESYTFECAYIYNSEIFLMGNKAKIVLQPRLYVNQSTPVGFEILKDVNITVTTYNDLSVPTATKFENLDVTHKKDIEIEFPVPAKVTSITIEVKASVEEMLKTKKKDVFSSHSIEIQTHSGSDSFCGLYLKRTQGGYEAYVLGKNGEPKAGITATVTLNHDYTHKQLQDTLATDSQGRIKLGQLTNINLVTISTNPKGDIKSLYGNWYLKQEHNLNYPSQELNLIEGDKLNFPISFTELTRDKVSLCLKAGGRIIFDMFKDLKVDKKVLQLPPLTAGRYVLTISEPKKVININIHKGSYWKYGSYIKSEGKLIEIRDQISNIIVEDIQIMPQEKNPELSDVRLKIFADHKDVARAHVFAYQFLPIDPNALVTSLDSIKREPGLSVTPTNIWKSIYMNNRRLGDEYVYVIDRKNQARYIGNTLERPAILLKREYVRDTTNLKEQLRSGDNYALDPFAQEAVEFESLQMQTQYNKPALLSHPQYVSQKRNMINMDLDLFTNDYHQQLQQHHSLRPISQSQSFDTMLNFLRSPSLLYSNLEISKDGTIEIKDFPHTRYACLQIVCTNLSANISSIVPLPATVIQTKDLCLKSQLRADKFYSISRGSSQINTGKSLEIKDLTSTEIQVIDSVPKLFEVLKQLRTCHGSDHEGGSERFDTWAFLKGWNLLSIEQKLDYYDKFASHELNIFVYFKDDEFFKKIVAPFITNKIKKDFVDYLLLGNEKEILEYSQPASVEKLSPLESMLMIFALRAKHPERAIAIAEKFENTVKLSKIDTQTFKRLFDTALNAKSENEKPIITTDGGNKNQPFNNASTTTSADAFDFHSGSASNLAMNANPFGSSQAQPNVGFNFGPISQTAFSNFSSGPIGGNFSNYSGPPSTGGGLFSNLSGPQMQHQPNLDDFEGFDPSVNKMMQQNQPSFDFYSQPQQKSQQYYDLDRPMLEQRKLLRGGFEELEKTKEYQERAYYSKSTSFSPNLFWSDLAKHLAKNGTEEPFLTQNLIYAAHSHVEMIGVLTFMTLAFQSGNYGYSSAGGRGVKITAESNILVLHKEIKEGEPQINSNILIAQRFFDPSDRYVHSDEDPSLVLEKDPKEFVINKIYGCQVVVTNCSIARQEFQVLCEIPEGAIPVKTIDYTKSHTMALAAYTTNKLEYFFYFPSPGTFKVYPANVAKDGVVFAIAKVQEFKVLKEGTSTNLETLDDILSKGSKTDILSFISTKNIWNPKVFNKENIYWLLKDKDFYLKLVEIFRARSYYDAVVWRHSLIHYDMTTIIEYFNTDEITEMFSKALNYIDNKVMHIDRSKVLEYHPFVSSRVHILANDKTNILNNQFREQYKQFLACMVEKGHLAPADLLVWSYYLLLQDRIDEAILVYKRINQKEINTTQEQFLQYDYLSAYLDFYTGYPNFKTARDIVEKYLNYPVLSWRRLFIDIANQLAEYDGEDIDDELQAANEKEDDLKRKNQKSADKEELVTVELEGKTLVITYQNVSEIWVNLFEINLEILFSQNPFLSQGSEDFAYVKPNFTQKLEVAKNQQIDKINPLTTGVKYEIPKEHQKNNLFIQISSAAKHANVTYFCTSLKIQLIENYGQVKVTDQENKPLTKVYVKCFAKDKNERVNFYKDGYTDLRGRFDYASVSSFDLSNFTKFSIFVMSDEFGSLIREVNPPPTIGKMEATLTIKSKNPKYQQYQQENLKQAKVSSKVAGFYK